MLTTSGRSTALLAAAAAAFTAPRSPEAVAALAGPDLPAALSGLLELGLLVVATWTVACLGLGSLRGAPGRLGRALLPAAVRAAVFTGVAGTALVAPAHATDGGWPLDGLQLAERSVVEAPPATPTRTEQPPPRTGAAVVVRPGDTLWALARTGLDDDATDARVAQEVHRWHRENRDVIGGDPDLLRPGQRLQAPADVEDVR